MDNKKFYYIVLLIMSLMSIISCSDSDEKGNFESFEETLFYGEWCSISGSMVSNITLDKNGSCNGKVYVDIGITPKEYEEIKGTWAYYPSSNSLLMSVYHSVNPRDERTSYKVIALNKYNLQLREVETGAEDNYCKVINNIMMEAGNTQKINIDGIIAKGYSSSNSAIASVSTDGLITANNQGIAFIQVSSDEGTAIVKVFVKARVAKYVSELSDKIDDIMKEYGTPDAMGAMGQNQAILYKSPLFDVALSNVQYQYDEVTREVTRVLTVYKSDSEYNVDRDYIIGNYIDHGSKLYGTEKDFASNKYILSPFTENGVNYISYGNHEYFNRTGHY